MQISQTQENVSGYTPELLTKNLTSNFQDVLNQTQDGEVDVQDITNEVNAQIQAKKLQQETQLQTFLDDLVTKGSSKFLSDMNEEKIEAKVEEYKQKLIDAMGDSSESMETIQDMVADYRKQLLEELQASSDNDDTKAQPGSIEAITNTLLKMQENTQKPLEQLLSS